MKDEKIEPISKITKAERYQDSEVRNSKLTTLNKLKPKKDAKNPAKVFMIQVSDTSENQRMELMA